MVINKEKALSELGITADIYEELIKDFLGQAEDSMRKLDEAVGKDDFPEVATIAHFLKGSAGNLRIEELQNAAKDLDLAAKEAKDKKLIGEKARNLKTAFQAVKQVA